MLGSLKRRHPWNWAAIGKHPAAADYIRLGTTSPLIDAVADWTAKGYQQMKPRKDQPAAFYSWRFWLRGVKKGEIVCGLGRDSSDRIGRRFPLLLVGAGRLAGWEKKWADLPVRLGRTWKSMEFVAARRFDDLQAMGDALTELHSPEAEQGTSLSKQESADGCRQDLARFRDKMVSEGFGVMRVNPSPHGDAELSVLECHRRLEAHCKQMPRGVFIGGTPQQTYLAAIVHPLGKADFMRLWSL